MTIMLLLKKLTWVPPVEKGAACPKATMPSALTALTQLLVSETCDRTPSISSTTIHTIAFLSFFLPHPQPLCAFCSLPLTTNPSITLSCSLCGKSFHDRCGWGRFYPSPATSWRYKQPEPWICSFCLANKNVDVFSPIRRKWVMMYVVRFDPATGRHTLKYRQELFSLRLRDYLVRKNMRWNRPEADILNTPTNSGLIESGEIRKYRGNQGLQASEDLNWHCLPQVVGESVCVECSLCFKAIRIRRKAISMRWCIESRRFGTEVE